MPNVQTPDGKVHSFPESTSPEAIQRALGNYMMNRSGPPMLQRAHPEMGIGPSTEENPGRGWRDQARAERFPGISVPGLGTMNLPAIGAAVGSVGGPPGAALGGGLGELGQQLGETLTGEPDLSSMPLSERASRIGTAGATAYGSAKVLPVLGGAVKAAARAVPQSVKSAILSRTPAWVRVLTRPGVAATTPPLTEPVSEPEPSGWAQRYMGSSAPASTPAAPPMPSSRGSMPTLPENARLDEAFDASLKAQHPQAGDRITQDLTRRYGQTGTEMAPRVKDLMGGRTAEEEAMIPNRGRGGPLLVSPKKAAYLQAQGIEPEAIENFHQPAQMPQAPGGGGIGPSPELAAAAEEAAGATPEVTLAPRPPVEEGLSPAGAEGALSNEELARNETFYRVGKGGVVTFLGKKPDANFARGGGAVVGIGPKGARVVNSSAMSDSFALGSLQKFLGTKP